ncbi:alpha/beta hydrolase [Aestuariivita sp.]|jgi:proline iminopeptidase|uniref:alpha/beta fold hydrolase n=1 Tax=Aestuariivita sp. TaxID=1872407 RepID=UPI00216DCAFA|nr:alpha/beta hydrolase [Aestuariivita sp.]MCE8007686.1 alpha/beta hydrolase [Aestuariivita sp.]
MYITVNDVRLFVDIEGPGLIADGPAMREKPTLITVHGGPGADHSLYKPAFSKLSDLCQIVYYDQRGNGRSEDGDPALWTLDQWGDDLHGLCQTLGIDRPIVFGASFGGVVAQSYATRHPGQARALILASTTARTEFEVIYDAFARLGGAETGAVARSYWSKPTPEGRQAYFERCLPLYTLRGLDPDAMARLIVKNPVGMHYNGPASEQGRFDFRAALGSVTCPTLVLSGDRDPIMPQSFGETLAQALPNARFERIEDAAHMLSIDRPSLFFRHVRQFIEEISTTE